jgi:mono/diheme cytochrome c family protein
MPFFLKTLTRRRRLFAMIGFVVSGALCGGIWLSAGTRAAAAVAAPPTALQQPGAADAHGALIERYCATCHNDRLKTGGLALNPALLRQVGESGESVELWEKVVVKLRNGAMPPSGASRPDQPSIDALADWLEAALDASGRQRMDPGRTAAFHRLNRIEYQNAIRDLLALDLDVASQLPADDSDEQGFDNVADVLSVSPVLLERYLSVARRVARLAVGRSPLAPIEESYKVPILLVQDDRMNEELPFGSRGGTAINHYFPIDGEYEIRIRLHRNYVNYIRGLGTPQELDVRLDGVLLKRFAIGGKAPGRPAPASYAGNIFGDPEWENYALYADSNLTLRFQAKAGPRVLGVAFVRNLTAPEGVLQPRQTVFAVAINDMRDGNAAVEEVVVGGPHAALGAGETPSRRRIFVCEPARPSEETPCARRILGRLARLAYRRPATAADVDTLLEFYDAGRDEGSFVAGIQAALERLLISPDFLFRIERDSAGTRPGTAYPLDDLALASRLSFFLWSSIPDEELLRLAERKELRKPAVADGQVRRMLADARAKALIDNFGGQWLYLRTLANVVPDPVAFPAFDENLRDAFRRETELFFESQIRDDRGVPELLKADYTFANQRLAEHYGIPNVYGSHFRRVALDERQAAIRGGILGQGSLLTVTSYPNRTSPVLRGKWVLTNILGTPPPPPPADVPDLPERGESGRPATVRERMEQHRRNPQCRVCHAPMDPLGLALENYDAVGEWRSVEGGLPIDVTGVLPDGSQFAGLGGMRTLLLERREQFVRTVTEKLLTYALGRAIGPRDRHFVRQIVRDAERRDYRWSAVINGIVASPLFRMRRSAA